MFQKLRNSLCPDIYRCEKCDQHNCEHLEKMDENEIEPMLVMKAGCENNSVVASTPSYSPLTNSPIVNRQNIPNHVNNSENSDTSAEQKGQA